MKEISCWRDKTKMSKSSKSTKKLVFLSASAKNLAKTSSLLLKRTLILMLSWPLRKGTEMNQRNLMLQLKLKISCKVLVRLEVVLGDNQRTNKLALLVEAVFNLRFLDPIL